MRFMVIIKSTPETEEGVMPSEALLTAMGNYNQQLVDAGLMLDGNGLHPSSKGARVRFSGEKRTVVDGPFTEAKELIAGYWILQAGSLAEVIEWVKKIPNEPGEESEIEIRQVHADEDFGEAFTPELQAQDARMRAQIEAQKQQGR